MRSRCEGFEVVGDIVVDVQVYGEILVSRYSMDP